MAVSSKDIETLWKRYQEDGSKRGISVESIAFWGHNLTRKTLEYRMPLFKEFPNQLSANKKIRCQKFGDNKYYIYICSINTIEICQETYM